MLLRNLFVDILLEKSKERFDVSELDTNMQKLIGRIEKLELERVSFRLQFLNNACD